MNKTIMIIADNGKGAYQKPDMELLDLLIEPTLQTLSDQETLDIIHEEEEEWPENPDTGQPYAPW